MSKLREMVRRIIKEETRKSLFENESIEDFITSIQRSGVSALHDKTGKKIVISGTSFKDVTKMLDKFAIGGKVEKEGNKIIVDYSKRDTDHEYSRGWFDNID